MGALYVITHVAGVNNTCHQLTQLLEMFAVVKTVLAVAV